MIQGRSFTRLILKSARFERIHLKVSRHSTGLLGGSAAPAQSPECRQMPPTPTINPQPLDV